MLLKSDIYPAFEMSVKWKPKLFQVSEGAFDALYEINSTAAVQNSNVMLIRWNMFQELVPSFVSVICPYDRQIRKVKFF
jgi:hypothetical protein